MFCFLAKCIILVFIGVLTIGIQNSFMLQVRYEPHNLSVKALCSEASRFSITEIWYAYLHILLTRLDNLRTASQTPKQPEFFNIRSLVIVSWICSRSCPCMTVGMRGDNGLRYWFYIIIRKVCYCFLTARYTFYKHALLLQNVTFLLLRSSITRQKTLFRVTLPHARCFREMSSFDLRHHP